MKTKDHCEISWRVLHHHFPQFSVSVSFHYNQCYQRLHITVIEIELYTSGNKNITAYVYVDRQILLNG